MPAKPLIDLARIDPSATVFGSAEIRARNSQRHEMEMLDRIVFYAPEEGLIAGIKEVRSDEFWVRGHFPGRPLLPGVLMIETAGQLCSYYFSSVRNDALTLGFAAADGVKFRGMVQPGDALLMVGQMVDMKARTARFAAQGFVRDRLIFEADIVGMVL